jgi:drug/metabolite transporter (DMT)-like permease
MTIPTLLTLRFGVAAVLIGGWLWSRGGLRLPRRSDAGAVVLMGLLYVGQAACFFGSLRSIPAAVTSILLYTYPVVVTLFAWLLLGERLTRVRIGALGLACIGVVLVIDPFGAGGLDAVGVGLGLGSAAVYSAYILTGSVLLRGIAAVPATAGIGATAAIVFAAAGVASGQLKGFDASGWAIVAGIAVIPTVVAATAFLAGLARVGPSVASTVSTLEPASTAVLAAIALGETLSPLQWAGGALVLVAAAILARATATADRERVAVER